MIALAASAIILFVLRWLCFNVFIIPKWIPIDRTEIGHITISFVEKGGELRIISIDDIEQKEEVYQLLNKTKIERLFFNTGHSTSDFTDCPIVIEIYSANGEKWRYMIRGIRNGGNLVKDQGESDFFWTYGRENSAFMDCINLLLEE